MGSTVSVLSMMHHSREQREWDLTQYQYDFSHKILPGMIFPRKDWPFPLCINFGVMKSLVKLNADVVVSSGGFSIANIAAFLYCKLWNKQFINWSEFTLEDGSSRSALKQIIRKILSRYADGSIASSSDSKDAFIYFGAAPEGVKVVLMPVDVATFHLTAAEFRASAEYQVLRDQYPGQVMIVVGRLDDIKGYREMFEIYERLVMKWKDLTMLIAGSGREADKYEKFVQQKGWANVRFLGFLEPPQLARSMALADFSVFPTLNDSFGAVIAEAMAAELPVVSSIYAYATRDLVVDGVTGFRFDPKNPLAACETISKMLSLDAAAKKRMGQRAYQKIRLHDCSSAAKLATGFFQSVVKRGYGGK